MLLEYNVNVTYNRNMKASDYGPKRAKFNLATYEKLTIMHRIILEDQNDVKLLKEFFSKFDGARGRFIGRAFIDAARQWLKENP